MMVDTTIQQGAVHVYSLFAEGCAFNERALFQHVCLRITHAVWFELVALISFNESFMV